MRKFLSCLFIFVVLFAAHQQSFARDAMQAFNSVPCDYPAYRYAMYRLDPADCELFIFNKSIDQLAGVAELKLTKDEWSISKKRNSSLSLTSVDFKNQSAMSVLPPIAVEHLTEQCLTEQLEFLTGACASTLAEQNPGVDLSLEYNLDGAAKSIVDEFGREERNELLAIVNDYFPEFFLAGETLPINSHQFVNSSDNSTIKDASLADRVGEKHALTQNKIDDNQQEDSNNDKNASEQSQPDNDVNRDDAQKTEQDNTDENQGAQGTDSDGGNQGGARSVSSEKTTKVSPDRMLMMVLGAVAAVVFAVGGLLLIAKAN